MSMSFKLPDLGEGIHEAEILEIPVAIGQEVKEGDTILAVETDKAAVEIPSPYTGIIKEICVEPGHIINVGDVIMTFSAEASSAPIQPTGTSKTGPVPAKPDQQQQPSSNEASSAPIQPTGKPRIGPVPASPSTRRLARELAVDLKSVTPTGPADLVTAEDVRSFAAKKEGIEDEVTVKAAVSASTGVSASSDVPVLPDFRKWGAVERIPFRSIRRATAKQMSLAWSQIPHVNSQDVIDVTRLDAFRKKHKAEIKAAGGNLTLTIFILKAIAIALKKYPNFNATLDTVNSEIILKQYLNIGVAVNTDRGLIVPVVREVDRKSIRELAIEVNELVQRTRAGKSSLEEMQGGTFTVTNAGAMGGAFFAPIINYPEVAILGVGQARMQPTAQENENGEYIVVPRLIMPIVLCIDHRVLDGADAFRFLKVLVDTLEDPDKLLMNMV